MSAVQIPSGRHERATATRDTRDRAIPSTCHESAPIWRQTRPERRLDAFLMSVSDPAGSEPTTLNAREVGPGLKFALELGPTLLFVICYTQGERIAALVDLPAAVSKPIFLATAVLMAAIGVSLAVSLALTRTVPVMPLVTGVVVFVFGGLTLWLQDAYFAYIKPTIVNCLFGSVLLAGLLFGRSLLKLVFDAAFDLTDEGWRKLTLRWGVFFFVLALVNELVWRNFSEAFWAGFKLWGFVPLTMAFTLAQMPLIARHTRSDEGASQGQGEA